MKNNVILELIIPVAFSTDMYFGSCIAAKLKETAAYFESP
jgi:hypothetical protein